ncbi:MAG TPA: aminopeptidase P family protein [Bacteroidota bacterium]|nr:aminopeptidase P family protein [Bacteroidota bacterium]
MSSRIQQLRRQFSRLSIDAFLVMFPPHVRYLTGFSGSNALCFISDDQQVLVTDGRYIAQVRKEVRGWRIYVTQDALFEEARAQRLFRAGMRIGIDGNTFSLSQYRLLKKSFPKVKFLPKVDTLERLTAVKDEQEIALIARAAAISDRVFREILGILRPGLKELDVAAELTYRQKTHGAEADAFEAIVASGERGAMPHGRASVKKLKRGELITLDFGCIVGGYHSDLTRTVALGAPPAEARKIYAIVLEAQQAAIARASNGVKAKEVDAAARTIIRNHGYEKFFRHSLGHGIGLQIHEQPRISMLSKATLEPGNVVTIEPGIYLPGFGGVRIEDDIVIRKGAAEILNHSSKDLLIL